MWVVWGVGCSRRGMFGTWDVQDVGYSGCEMSGMWHVGMWDVGVRDVQDVTCSRCEM